MFGVHSQAVIVTNPSLGSSRSLAVKLTTSTEPIAVGRPLRPRLVVPDRGFCSTHTAAAIGNRPEPVPAATASPSVKAFLAAVSMPAGIAIPWKTPVRIEPSVAMPRPVRGARTPSDSPLRVTRGQPNAAPVNASHPDVSCRHNPEDSRHDRTGLGDRGRSGARTPVGDWLTGSHGRRTYPDAEMLAPPPSAHSGSDRVQLFAGFVVEFDIGDREVLLQVRH